MKKVFALMIAFIGTMLLNSCDKDNNNYQVSLDYVVTAENCSDLPKLEQYM